MIGAAVAMKGISAQVTHRAAAGLVALDLRDEAAIRAAHAALHATAAETGIALEGVYVQKMIAGRAEIIVSALRDPVAGVVVSCGAGGGLVEVIDDVAIARAPIDQDGARRLLARLRLVRGLVASRRAPDLDALAGFVAEFSQLAACAPWERFVLEVNPLVWSAAGVTAVDGLVIIEAC
jgi:succinyl-CoA synthetase beta subunit